MKTKNIFLIIGLVLFCLSATQSCTSDEVNPAKVYVAAVPGGPSPAQDGIVAFSGAPVTVKLEWAGTATDAKWDVYLGTSETSLVKLNATSIADNFYNASITSGGTYYWKVVTLDANNVKSTSPTWSFQVNSNPAASTIVSPALSAVGVSCNPTLEWAATDPESDDLTYDVYIGTTSTPGDAYTALTASKLDIATSLSENTQYYWKVVAKDPYGGTSTSPVWSFTTGLLPVNTYVGTFLTDEPAEAYTYDVAFTKASTTTIKTTNYWNSKWTAVFTLDFTKLTYTMPNTTWTSGYTGVESGVIDPKTGKMTGTYTIWKNGVVEEQGVHTYTKK